MNEKEKKPVQELTDEQVEQSSGGVQLKIKRQVCRWICECGTHNLDGTYMCKNCKRSRERKDKTYMRFE